MTLIGLGGRLRSGKDAIADHLVAQHGFVKLGMSDALHEAMLAIDPIINAGSFGRDDSVFTVRYSEAIEDLGYVEAKKIPEVRRLLQKLGTEVGRNMIGEDTWADLMERKTDALRAEGKKVVVTGVRFPNELALFLGQHDAIALWVNRPGVEAPSTGATAHASENSVDESDFAWAIDNDGTLEQLYEKVDFIVNELEEASR